MNPFNPAVTQMHAAYCEAVAIELTLNFTFDRWWQTALSMGLTADDVRLCVKERLRFNAKSAFKKGIELRHLIRDQDDVAMCLNEAAVVRAQMRLKIVDPGKASVLKATGRPVEEETKTRHISEVIDAMRKQAS